MAIIVYNRTKESHGGPNNYPIFRPSVLGNPFTHIKERNTKAMYVVGSRDEAIDRYSEYFDIMYGANRAFTKVIDEIYEKYKNGEDVYLECYCKKYCTEDQNKHIDEVRCHGDIIAEKLRKRLIKEKFKSIYKSNAGTVTPLNNDNTP